MNHDPEHLKRVARIVRDLHGIELAPDQVADSLDKTIATIRDEMVKAGHPEFATMPDDEVYESLRDAMVMPNPDDPSSWSDEECERVMAEFADTPDESTPEQREAMWQSFRQFAGWDKDDAK